MSAQLMTAEETVYGTPVTTDRGFEFRSESLKLDIERIESQGIRAGQRVLRSAQWYPGKKSVSGDVVMEMGNKGFGRWWKHALGGTVTSQPDAANSPTVYRHTFTPGDLPTGQTIQVGRPDVTGTVRPFTYHGCTVASWKLEAAVSELAVLTMSMLGEDEDTATSLAAVSYPTGLSGMTFVNGTLSVASSNLDVKSVSVEGKNGIADDRYFMGSQLRKQPLEQALREFSGTMEPEFESLTAYNRFVNGTEAALVLTFAGGIIEDALTFQTVLTANIRFDGETPAIGGREIVKQTLPWKVIDNSTTSIKVEYQTSDATP
ncbi:phage tail tube protein [Actinophytocola sp.]|uniref:phage tail tube protein n=1 Tax=Actinophytocola sp. TaxID=1872138 RepID=UPI002D475B63|nr:phage tail tube protein [Actinophytocola sp.]HYQ63555.1 phage tail tube protein [Actinophytocola sp.]